MKELIRRRFALQMTTYIPDVAAHADEWNKLAADFEAIGALVNAAVCRSMWRYYAAMEPGAYLQIGSPQLIGAVS